MEKQGYEAQGKPVPQALETKLQHAKENEAGMQKMADNAFQDDSVGKALASNSTGSDSQEDSSNATNTNATNTNATNTGTQNSTSDENSEMPEATQEAAEKVDAANGLISKLQQDSETLEQKKANGANEDDIKEFEEKLKDEVHKAKSVQKKAEDACGQDNLCSRGMELLK